MHDLVLGALVFMPVVITFFLKSNAGLGFLTLCLGFLLSTSVIGDLEQLLSQQNLSVANETLAGVLIGLPFLITLLITSKTAGKELGYFIHLITAFFAGCLLAITIGPLLGSAGQFNVEQSQAWSTLVRLQAAVIGCGSVLSLLLVWSGPIKKAKKHKD